MIYKGSLLAVHEHCKRIVVMFTSHIHIFSWEIGDIENMNGLIRQYIPKKTAFKDVSKGMIEIGIEKSNNRPRKMYL